MNHARVRSATRDNGSRTGRQGVWIWAGGLFLLAAALALRALRLTWQPLWWDEGYSVYFATESLAAMVRLTAQDIHPPLYYALLHAWILLWGSAAPLALRTFSLLVGALTVPALAWVAGILFPGRSRLRLLALLLLTLSPMHLFYSQEVRMYGLELLLGLLSTGFLWRLLHADTRGAQRRAGVGYVLATAAALYTEYYAAFLPLAHLLWAAIRWRRQPRRLLPLLLADSLVALLYLPWIALALPQLIPYVDQKILADQDRPLALLPYLGRHLLAFTAGHVPPPAPWPDLRLAGPLALLPLLGAGLLKRLRPSLPEPVAALLIFLLLPLGLGFLLNLRLPFFPEGGERVLLFVLPYFLLLLAWGLDRSLEAAPWLGWSSAALLLAGAATGILAFYTAPRYTTEDYRPLIGQVVQQGRDQDTVFLVFPWQVGYWRAYAPVYGRGERHGPWPQLTPSPAWNAQVAAALDEALARGRVWFPAHLALGGILEGQIEAHLAARAVNFVNRWYSPTTRLSAWAPQEAPASGEAQGSGSVQVDFGPVGLSRVRVAPGVIPSANQVLRLELSWQVTDPSAGPFWVTLRLLDDDGRIWSLRDYEPLGLWGRPGPGGVLQERVGLLAPVGLPPGAYRLALGVGRVGSQALLPLLQADNPAAGTGASGELATLATVTVTEPDAPLPPLRLPVQWPLSPPPEREGLAFLGYAGYAPEQPPLAGEILPLRLFFQNRAQSLPHRELSLDLLDSEGRWVAGWQGWPLPDYPTERWPPGALVQTPVDFPLPATLVSGRYRLLASLVDPAGGAAGESAKDPVTLGWLQIRQRPANFQPPSPQFPLDPPPQFGTHARLLGYDLTREDGALLLVLHWEVLQTLLPSHHVFVHLDGPDGRTLAQDDGVPGGSETPAPTGSWRPGEFIADPHRLSLPPELPELPPGAVIRVGLYRPDTGVRLPVTLDGQPAGDAASLPLR